MSDIPEFQFTLNPGLDDSFLPTQAEKHATGWDVRAAETVIFQPTITVKVPLGLRCFSPYGYWLELRPRSSTFAKKNLSALYGVIDQNYEGQIIAALQWLPPYYEVGNDLKDYLSQQMVVEKGERLCQIVPVRRQIMKVKAISEEEFNDLCQIRGGERGAGGFGSSGG
jgi:deoxyuridine 5'-triphosphate nucleotidohydrolase